MSSDVNCDETYKRYKEKIDNHTKSLVRTDLVPRATDLFTIHDISLTFRKMFRSYVFTLRKFVLGTVDGDRNPFLLQAHEIGIFIDRGYLLKN